MAVVVAVVVAGAATSLAGCAKRVPQDLHTGADGVPAGARAIKLENNEGRARGIVSYPGGDRVDWRVIELPPGQTGQLELTLRWTPPRPGLDLSFEVYNQYGRTLASARPIANRTSRRARKSVTIDGASGKVRVQIYASGRGDAGAYTLLATWKPTVVDTFDWATQEVADPPRLPAVPLPEPGCTPDDFDKKRRSCVDVCPREYDASWPACFDTCPVPPRPEIKACKLCDKNQLDPCLPDCRQYYAECNLAAIDMKNPTCWDKRAPAISAQLTDITPADDGTLVTVGAGNTDGLTKSWTGALVDRAGTAVRGGALRVISIGKDYTRAKVALTAIPAGATVVLTPPPPPPAPVCK